jgi:hypothetical protein
MVGRVLASLPVSPLTVTIRPTRDVVRRLRALLADLDYAQRRVLELRTGLVLTAETKRAIVRAEIDWLNALYADDR